MKRVYIILLALMLCGNAVAAESKIVVSINPIHSLVAAVMDGIQSPELLIKGTDSVHGYQTKPSDAQLLESADVIVWIGPTMESTLIASVSNLPESTAVIEVGALHGLHLYETRESPEGEHRDEHDEHGHDDDHHADENDEHGHDEHDEHGHDEHDEHGHDEHDEHGHDEHGHDEHDEHDHGDEMADAHDESHGDEDGDHHGHDDHSDEEQHAHGRYDMHIWLDIDNAKVITKEAAEQLASIFPQDQAQLTSNMNKTLEKLDELEAELRSLSKSFSDSPFVVFHDAYQYLEKMLGLHNVGTVTVNPERAAGAKRLLELRETITDTGASCVFKEPQFSPKILEIVTEDTDLKIGTLDPLGSDVEPGPNAYFEIMRNMVTSLKECLG